MKWRWSNFIDIVSLTVMIGRLQRVGGAIAISVLESYIVLAVDTNLILPFNVMNIIGSKFLILVILLE